MMERTTELSDRWYGSFQGFRSQQIAFLGGMELDRRISCVVLAFL